jgi:phage terminase large subunit
MLLRGDKIPTGAVVVRANWSDNPWFTDVLEQERLDCIANTPEEYDHVWEGGYATIASGAYFAQGLVAARSEGRIGKVPRDPLMEVRAYWDIGGAGARADATAIWLVQQCGKEVRWLDHYEASGQPMEAHVNWLRSRGYQIRTCVLPHDGAQSDKVFAASYEGALKQAGFDVRVIPNQGRGAAASRVESFRRLLPSCWFNEATTADGVEALGWYHEKRDEDRGMGMGPEHDWSSHSADAAGLVAVALAIQENKDKPPAFKRVGVV